MADMKDKVVVVTGANSGIGLVTAKELAKKGATVVLGCRNAARADAAVTEIREAAGHDRVESITVDVASKSDVLDFGAQFKDKYDRLDVLVNNAGVSLKRHELTDDGWERMFAINHLGYFMMAHVLTDVMEAGARIVNVASAAHYGGKIQLNNLNGERSFQPLLQYCHTKLANILFTRALAERLRSRKITVNCLHPGAIRSGFAQDEPSLFGTLVKLGGPFLIGPEKGARTTIYLASAPEVDGMSGRYFVRSKPAYCAPKARNDRSAEDLWQASARLTGMDLNA